MSVIVEFSKIAGGRRRTIETNVRAADRAEVSDVTKVDLLIFRAARLQKEVKDVAEQALFVLGLSLFRLRQIASKIDRSGADTNPLCFQLANIEELLNVAHAKLSEIQIYPNVEGADV